MRLPDDLCQQAARLLHQRHGERLEPGETFSISGTLDANEAVIAIDLDAPGGHDRRTFTVRVRVPEGASDADEALARGLDGGDAFVGEWLEEGRATRHPIDFVTHRFDGRPIEVKVERRRPALEDEADRLLSGQKPAPGEDA